ncbi:MAG: complex I NDUFA9 subunit family protein [Rhodospirillaceae bacterium]|nr:complex I NDUFA9 subunit family protein [Rhodospirillaceae bacterium]
MAGKFVTVFGGSGFIGRHVVRHLAAQGWRVRIAVRDIEEAGFLRTAGNLGQISAIATTIADDASVAAAVKGADAVINLVGVLYERGKRTFQALHVDGARRIAEAARAAGATHLVHVSALGADANSPSKYARSKAAGEAAVHGAFPGATIFRPSVVFGAEDHFFNMFGCLAQISPVLPYFTDITPHTPGGGGAKFQPVFVGDVAEAIAASVTGETHKGRSYELAGPKVYDMFEVLTIVNRETMRKRAIWGMPYLFAHIKAAFLQFLPTPLLTPDQVKLLKLGSVASGRAPGLEAFGIAATPVELVVPTYLKRFRPVQQTKKIRAGGKLGAH